MHSIWGMRSSAGGKHGSRVARALWGDIYEDTVAIYESLTARSDHDSFQNIGVATLGWNGSWMGIPAITVSVTPWRP